MCLFGVSSELKGYRMFDPVAKKILVSRDVVSKKIINEIGKILTMKQNWTGEILLILKRT